MTGGTQIDITNTVGSFTFSQTNNAVAKLNISDPALNNNNGKQITQARFTAAAPGLTQIFRQHRGSYRSAHGNSRLCTWCNRSNLQVGNAATNTSFAVANNTTGVTLTPTVTDRLGNELKESRSHPHLLLIVRCQRHRRLAEVARRVALPRLRPRLRAESALPLNACRPLAMSEFSRFNPCTPPRRRRSATTSATRSWD